MAVWTDKFNMKHYILDPFSVIVKLAILSKKPIAFRITSTATDSTGEPAANVQVCMYVTADGAPPSSPACATSDVYGRAAWDYAFPDNFNTEGRGLVTVTYQLSVGDPISGTQSFRVYLVKP